MTAKNEIGKKKDERQNYLIWLLNNPQRRAADVKDSPGACACHLLSEQTTDEGNR